MAPGARHLPPGARHVPPGARHFAQFLEESRPKILIALLTAVIQPTSPITQVTILNPEVSKKNLGDKGIELDLLVHLDDGTQANVEMQGEAKGQAGTILKILSARGIPLTTEDRARVMACRDVSVLDKLLHRALTLQPGEELFEGQPDEGSAG